MLCRGEIGGRRTGRCGAGAVTRSGKGVVAAKRQRRAAMPPMMREPCRLHCVHHCGLTEAFACGDLRCGNARKMGWATHDQTAAETLFQAVCVYGGKFMGLCCVPQHGAEMLREARA